LLNGLRKRLPPSIKDRLRPAYHFALDVLDLVDGHRRAGLPPSRILLPQVGRRDGAFFHAGARWMADTVRTECGLEPGGRVLDLGCGVGRLAIGLLDYVDETGRYDGLDVDARSIRWAKAHVERRHPGFRFQVADVRNAQYNPHGQFPPERYTFPYEQDAFDVAFLHSVFTHMRPLALERYLSELARVVRRGGYTHISYYLLNDEARRFASEGRAAFDFRFDFGDHRSISAETPEYSIAYEETVLRELYARHGLVIERVDYGSWSGRPGARTFQDIVLARPA
jgi:SAM-dependent methyltransferase